MNPVWQLFAAALAIGTTSLTMFVVLPTLRNRVPDVPNERSSHLTITPRGGGGAVVIGAALSVALTLVLAPTTPTFASAAWGGVAVLGLAITGLVDDLGGLSVSSRLIVTCSLAALVALTLPVASVLARTVAAISIVVYVNAFNFMDGINGISAISCIVTAGWLLWVGNAIGAQGSTLLWAAALLGAAIGFLPFNVPHARVFLGDVGSYFLGGALVVAALLAWLDRAPLMWIAAPFAPYLADTGFALAGRLLGGRPIGQAHREHRYQRLVDGGRSHLGVSLFLGAVTLACCGAALLPVVWAGVVLSLVLCLYLWAPRIDRRLRLLGMAAT